jgi:hypothetical protein
MGRHHATFYALSAAQRPEFQRNSGALPTGIRGDCKPRGDTLNRTTRRTGQAREQATPGAGHAGSRPRRGQGRSWEQADHGGSARRRRGKTRNPESKRRCHVKAAMPWSFRHGATAGPAARRPCQAVGYLMLSLTLKHPGPISTRLVWAPRTGPQNRARAAPGRFACSPRSPVAFSAPPMTAR